MPPRKSKKVIEEDIDAGNVVNFYKTMSQQFLDAKLPNPNFHLHNFNIPFGLCCVAPSGGGKSLCTNLISLFSKGSGTFS